MGSPFGGVSLDTNTRVQQEHLVTRLHMTDHSFLLSVSNVYHQRLGATHRFPKRVRIDNRFLEVNETLDQMMIHPNGSYPHSHAACPIFVISGCEA